MIEKLNIKKYYFFFYLTLKHFLQANIQTKDQTQVINLRCLLRYRLIIKRQFYITKT